MATASRPCGSFKLAQTTAPAKMHLAFSTIWMTDRSDEWKVPKKSIWTLLGHYLIKCSNKFIIDKKQLDVVRPQEGLVRDMLENSAATWCRTEFGSNSFRDES